MLDVVFDFEQLKEENETLKDRLSQQQQAVQYVLDTISTAELQTAAAADAETPLVQKLVDDLQ